MKKYIFASCIALTTLPSYSTINNGYFTTGNDAIIWELDWENNPYYTSERSSSSNLKWSNVARKGTHGVKIKITRDDPLLYGGRRTEIIAPLEIGDEIERWYAFSTYMPDSYVYSGYPESIFQIHTSPIDNNWERYVTVPIVLLTQNGQYYLNVIGSNLVPSPILDEQKVVNNLGSHQNDTNKWSDWVLQIKFSGDEETGFVNLWKDDILLLQYQGSVGYSVNSLDHRTYAKIGLYRWYWMDHDVDSRTLYYDRIRIGNKYATYNIMNEDIMQ